MRERERERERERGGGSGGSLQGDSCGAAVRESVQGGTGVGGHCVGEGGGESSGDAR